MTTAPAPNRRRRVLRPHHGRRLFGSVLAGLLLFAGLGGCLQQDVVSGSGDQGPRVLGLYEFEVDGIGTDTMTTSVRRVDLDGEVGQQSGLGPNITGITFSNYVTGRNACVSGYSCPWFSASVTPPTERTNLTFVAVSPKDLSVDASAFELVDPSVSDAGLITPAVKDEDGAFRLDDVLDGLSTVAFAEDEFSDRLGLSDYIDTVFPYGFVVTAADGSLSRTISGGTASGQLYVGFRVPSATPVARLVVWMAAIEDTVTRLALPPEYTGRENMTAFFDHLGRISVANATVKAGEVTAVLLGEGDGVDDRDVVSVTADAWRDGSDTVDIINKLSVEEHGNVRVAGGFSSQADATWPSAPAVASEVGKIAVRFTSPGVDYSFVGPTSGTMDVDYLIVGGGGGGGSAGPYGGGGGGGGGEVLSNLEALALSAATYPVSVGAGGAGGPWGTKRGDDGAPSVFDTNNTANNTAEGGGAGGVSFGEQDGASAATGGGAGGGHVAGTPGTGNPGGHGGSAVAGQTGTSPRMGGGGGGAAGDGGDATVGETAGDGGVGVESQITGTTVRYGGGGGGGSGTDGTEAKNTEPAGQGADGGGTGGKQVDGSPGVDGLGGGGGGAGGTGLANRGSMGGDGGSGIVIVQYPVPQ
jgi:hypothetical protein